MLKFDEQLKDIEKMFDTFPFGKSTVELRLDKDATPADADAVIGKFLKSIGLK